MRVPTYDEQFRIEDSAAGGLEAETLCAAVKYISMIRKVNYGCEKRGESYSENGAEIPSEY
jgi:hypothetical protein